MTARNDTTPEGWRNEQHRCSRCRSRFEVLHRGNALETAVDVEVSCPCCGAPHIVTVPRGVESDLRVEPLPGPEPETGVQD
jgi:hypothetical protein